MHTEYFNIHDMLTFELRNHLNDGGYLKDINPEYDYFKVQKITKPDFVINIKRFINREGCKVVDGKYYVKNDYFYVADSVGLYNWELEIEGWNTRQTNVNAYCDFVGVRKWIKYSAIKNVFVRPLIFLHLIKNGSALIHSGAVSHNDKGYLFVGRPGVFKTSIVMDLIRRHDAKFLGEENTLIKDGLAYPFPFNLKSFSYKIRKFDNENPSGRYQKLQLACNVLLGRELDNVPLSRPCKIHAVFWLEKNDEFSIDRIDFDKEARKNFTRNEKAEIGLAPTHTFSGISKNCFDEYLSAYSSCYPGSFVNNMWMKLDRIISKSYKNVPIFSVKVPQEYHRHFCEKIIKEI